MRFSRIPGQVVLSGAVPDKTARRVIETYAAARFGQAALVPVLTLANSGAGPGVSAGWEAAALVALDALSGVSEGEADCRRGGSRSGDHCRPRRGGAAAPADGGRGAGGLCGRERIDHRFARAGGGGAPVGAALCGGSERSGQGTTDRIRPGQCRVRGGQPGGARPVGRDPPALRQRRIEIGGHTDSQGSKGLNQRLSRARAEAVLDALIARGVPLDRLPPGAMARSIRSPATKPRQPDAEPADRFHGVGLGALGPKAGE